MAEASQSGGRVYSREAWGKALLLGISEGLTGVYYELGPGCCTDARSA